MPLTTIAVAQKHIDRRQHFWQCPIALAINERLPHGYYSLVGMYDIRICRQKKVVHAVPTPEDVAKAVFDYDEHGKMEPFSFPLALPRWTQ